MSEEGFPPPAAADNEELGASHTFVFDPINSAQNLDEEAATLGNPMSISTFAELVNKRLSEFGEVQKDLVDALLTEVIGDSYAQPTAVQSAFWTGLSCQSSISQPSNWLVMAHTGSGKTIAFLLPVFLKVLNSPSVECPIAAPLALVIAPTRELCEQIHNVASSLALNLSTQRIIVYSAVGGVQYSKQCREIELSPPHILIATLGRLLSLCGEVSSSSSRWASEGRVISPSPAIVSLAYVQMLVLDECDAILNPAFAPDVATLQTLLVRPLLLLFSATWTSDKILQPFTAFNRDNWKLVILDHQEDTNPSTTMLLSVPSTVTQIVEVLIPIGKGKQSDKGFNRLCEILRDNVSGQILIFALHISETKEISRALNREFSSDERSAGAAQDNMDMFCAPLHGDMTTCARRSTLDSFRTGRIRVLVCTDVASRGLDVELGVSVVINMSIGMSINDYVHRCGRTGRGGEKGLAYTFLVKGDEHLSSALISVLRQSGQRIPTQLMELAKHVSVKGASASTIRDTDEEDDRRQQQLENREKQRLQQETKMLKERGQNGKTLKSTGGGGSRSFKGKGGKK